MIYNTVRIYPKGDNFGVQFDSMSSVEQVDTKTKPHALGFYHYPSTMPKEKAMKKLVCCMIKAHEEELDRLNKSLAALKQIAVR